MKVVYKGNQEPHEVKKNYFDLGGNRTHDLSVPPFVFLVLRGTTFIRTLTFSSPRFTT